MNYFTDVFMPSRTRVFQRLFSDHPWLLSFRRLILGESFKFRVNINNGDTVEKYFLSEGPDGSLTLLDKSEGSDLITRRITPNIAIRVDEDYLKEWVENEAKMLENPLPYFFYYTLRTIFRIRLN